jgi:hypothetical protein
MNLRFVSLLGLASAGALACANGASDNGFSRTAAGGGGSAGSAGSTGFGVGGSSGGSIGTGTAGSIGTTNPTTDQVQPDCMSACTDFPAMPIIDDGVGQGDITGFPTDTNNLGGSPAFCLMEPQLGDGTNPGAMFPANWLRPRFRWDNGTGGVFEIRMHADVEANDLVAYTKSDHWILPFEIWQHLGLNARHVDVTVRAMINGQLTGQKGSFEIAPVNAGGTLVYWGTNSGTVTPDSSFLVTFKVGDEAVAKALTLPQLNAGPGAQPYWGPILNENGKDIRHTYDLPPPGFTKGQVQCIGCHIQTPDKAAVVFTDDWPWDKIVSSIDPNGTGIGTVPTYVSQGGRALLKQPGLGTSTASLAAWSAQTGYRVITSYYQDVLSDPTAPQRIPFSNPATIDTNKGMPPAERLIWIDVGTAAPIPPLPGDVNAGMDATQQAARNTQIIASRGTAWDYVRVDGETFPANILPNWSKDGTALVYTAATQSENGGLSKHSAVEADLHYVPMTGANIGKMQPVPGAAEKGVMEYYPTFSPDNSFIAYTRVGDMSCAGYYNANGEVFLVDNAGNKTRLAANDPPACSAQRSPGILNSWPKWAPNVKSVDGSNYYFVIFSSARKYQDPLLLPANANNPLACIPNIPSQLYVAAVVKGKDGSLTTYPGIYMWNQAYQQIGSGATATAAPFKSNNLTPAWDEFESIKVDVPQGIIR